MEDVRYPLLMWELLHFGELCQVHNFDRGQDFWRSDIVSHSVSVFLIVLGNMIDNEEADFAASKGDGRVSGAPLARPWHVSGEIIKVAPTN